MTIKPFFFCFIVLTSFWRCSKFEVSQPSYIKINQIDFAVKNSNHGSNSAKITDAWIYVNDNLLGAFELPCDIPISNSGAVKITIAGGIKNTGQSSIREKYPFYTWFDTTITLNKEHYLLSPKLSYLDSSQFLWIGNFESNSSYLLKESDSDTSIYTTTNLADVFEGNISGEITVNNSNPRGKVKSNFNFNAPMAGKRVFLEMNYSCNAPLIVGMIANAGTSNTQLPIVTLSATKMQWNKVYVDLTNTLAQENYTGKFEFYFEIQQISGEENKARFDNIKMISQK